MSVMRSGNEVDLSSKLKFKYPRAVLLSRYKHFESPRGLEAHSAVHSAQCILPELFGTSALSGVHGAVAALPARVKRTISELNEKSRPTQPQPVDGSAGCAKKKGQGNSDPQHYPPVNSPPDDKKVDDILNTRAGDPPTNVSAVSPSYGGYTSEMWNKMEERVKEAANSRIQHAPPMAPTPDPRAKQLATDFQSLLQRAVATSIPPNTDTLRPQAKIPPLNWVVRWSDGRPLFFAENDAQAGAMARQLASANDENPVLREQYEASVFILYNDLTNRRKIQYPPPLATDLTTDTMLDLRQLLWKTSVLLPELSQWEQAERAAVLRPPRLVRISDDAQWEYLDPSNTVQGPFSNTKMREWYIREFFPYDLPVRRAGVGPTPFISLLDLYSPDDCLVPFVHLPLRWVAPNCKPQVKNLAHNEVPNWSMTAKPCSYGQTKEAMDPTALVGSYVPMVNAASSPPKVATNDPEQNTSGPIPPANAWQQRANAQMSNAANRAQARPAVVKPIPATAASSMNLQNPKSLNTHTLPANDCNCPNVPEAIAPSPSRPRDNGGVAKTVGLLGAGAPSIINAASQQQSSQGSPSTITGLLGSVIPGGVGNTWEGNKDLPLSWASRRADSGNATSEISGEGQNNMDCVDLGPSIQESRVISPTTQACNEMGSSKTGSGSRALASKKAKGKKQALGDLLIEQSAKPAAKWAWGNRPVNPWGSGGDTMPGAPNNSGGPTSNNMRINTSVESGNDEKVAASETNVGTTGENTKAASNKTGESATTTTNEGQPSSLIISERKVDREIREEVLFLCARHNITFDEDFIDLLASLQSREAMALVLSDNLGNIPTGQIDEFTDELWGLIRNPFKVVKKGIVSTNVIPGGGGKKGKKTPKRSNR